LQRPEHRLGIFRGVDRAQAGEDVEVFLAEPDATIGEAERLDLPLVPADRPVALADPNDLLDGRELFERLHWQRRRRSQEIDLRQHAGGALDLAGHRLHVGIPLPQMNTDERRWRQA